MSDDPSKPLAAVEAMRADWAVVDPLMGGTRAMRAAGPNLLAKWPKEEDDAYKARLATSTLFPAYSETVANMKGRVFAEPVQLGEDVPEEIAAYMQDVDQQGNNLQVWSESVFTVGLSRGLCHVLVDYPPTVDRDGNQIVRTRADEKSLKLRPYAVMIRPQQVLGWRYKVENGAPVLTQFRYMEVVSEEEGEFGSQDVQQIRVLEIGKWRTFRRIEGKKGWSEHDSGTTSLGVIPLATFYTKRTGYLTAEPPLMELAHLNIKHWQSQSDQDNILHVARVPLLVAINPGDYQDAAGNPVPWEMTIGTSSATRMGADGDLKYVEHTGKAIEAGRQSLLDLEDQMRQAGAKLLKKDKQATKTATQAEEEAAQEMSPLQTMAGQFEDFLDQVLQLFALWKGLDEGGHVAVNGNFDIDYAAETTMPLLREMAKDNQISLETLFNEIRRRGVISDDIKWEDELKRISTQRSRVDATLLGQLLAAKMTGNISPESVWDYIMNGYIPARAWSAEAAKVENPQDAE